ncbi:hypothetical protein Tco_0658210 [Tanacetum coccineum]
MVSGYGRHLKGGRGRGGRCPPRCQLCLTNGHYASSCLSLYTYASNAATSDANLAQAFTSQCHVTQGHPDWYVDSGAMAHMTSSPDNVLAFSPSFVVHFSRRWATHIRCPVPESRPTHTRPSSLSPCGLCPIPTTPAEPIHGPDLTPSSPYSSEDDNPPTDTDDVYSHGAPPATALTEPSSVHQMKTRSKSGIFKTKHCPDFVSLTSYALHAALFSFV